MGCEGVKFITDALSSLFSFCDQAYKEGWLVYAIIGIIALFVLALIKG